MTTQQPQHIDLRTPREKKSPTHNLPPGRFLHIFGILVFLLAFGYILYRFVPWTGLIHRDSPSIETSQVLQDIARHMILPVSGEPRIGTIRNTEEFENDPFLSQAREDDVVVFYPHNETMVKAILYRPSADRIVDVSFVTLPKSGSRN